MSEASLLHEVVRNNLPISLAVAEARACDGHGLL
jgi:hypothetical protein